MPYFKQNYNYNFILTCHVLHILYRRDGSRISVDSQYCILQYKMCHSSYRRSVVHGTDPHKNSSSVGNDSPGGMNIPQLSDNRVIDPLPVNSRQQSPTPRCCIAFQASSFAPVGPPLSNASGGGGAIGCGAGKSWFKKGTPHKGDKAQLARSNHSKRRQNPSVLYSATVRMSQIIILLHLCQEKERNVAFI